MILLTKFNVVTNQYAKVILSTHTYTATNLLINSTNGQLTVLLSEP